MNVALDPPLVIQTWKRAVSTMLGEYKKKAKIAENMYKVVHVRWVDVM